MGVLTERVQVLFSPTQLDRLQAVARREGRSVGALIRDAVEVQYLSEDEARRLEAVRRLAAMALPVDDWAVMERECVRWAGDDDADPVH
jgi:hypothetical protein